MSNATIDVKIARLMCVADTRYLQLFDLMSELKLYGMNAAFDEVMATAVKRQHEPQRIVGELLNAEISEKQARSIKYQLTIAKLPLAKDLDGSG